VINEVKHLKITQYDIDLEKAVEIINKKCYNKVILQIPEGLKTHFSRFVEFLEHKTKASIIISADPCFGACDIPCSDFKYLDVDFVIQIGHTDIPFIKDFSIPTLFINAKTDIDISKVIVKAINLLEGKKIGLITTAQHVDLLDKASRVLIDNKYEPIIGKGDNRIAIKGQILGCNFSSAENLVNNVDCYLFIGSGNFHPLGLLLSTNKPVVSIDPYTSEIRKKELNDLRDMVIRQRYGAIARSKNAKKFGILVGLKKGQQRIDLAYKLKEKIDAKKKESYIFVVNHFQPVYLESYRDIDCFVSTACPRIAIDDYMQYKIPIITPIELDILLGYKKWENYKFDEIRN
jgi:2-(3-amino-3-carboxypropyl)histidine synthase